MSKTTKITLGLLIASIAVGACVFGIELPTILLYKAKQDAHCIVDAPTVQNVANRVLPDRKRNFETVPLRVVLPKMTAPTQPLASEEFFSHRLRFPQPLARERIGSSGSGLQLTYPGYAVVFLMRPISIASYDAEYGKLFHQTQFEHQLQVYQTRPADIDAAPHLDALKLVNLRLAEKNTTLWYYTYLAFFNQDDRQGFIEACDNIPLKMHFTISIPQTKAAIGAFVQSDSAVSPDDVLRFISLFELEPLPPSSTQATKTVTPQR
jgi:hypothetical protein